VTQEFFAIVESRRTIRDFLPDPVPQEVLDRCLDAALKAASSSNLQHWEYVIIRSPEARREANAVCLSQKGPATAPLLIAVVAHTDTWQRTSRFMLDTLQTRGILRPSQEDYWGRHINLLYTSGPLGLLGLAKKAFSRVSSLFKPVHNFMSRYDLRVMAHKSTALSAATFMLALRAEGYDSCPMEGFDPWRAKKLLGLGQGAEVCMFLAVGKRGPKALWWERILVPKAWTVREL
jgi:nitroreductase